MANVGYATLTILPSARGFATALGSEINPQLAAASGESGRRSGGAFAGGFLPLMTKMIGPLAGIGVGVALGKGILSGLKTSGFLEQATISFETLLGSSGAAQKMIADLSNFAKKTPFELPGLIDNARALVGAGTAAGNVIPTMTALGDTAGALGLDQERLNRVMIAYNQIQTKGKLQSEELMQITEAGIPVWQLLSKALGQPASEIQKLATDGKLLAADTLPLLLAQMNADYGGSMVKQSQTLNGVWSSFKDTLNIAMAQGLQPLIPILTTILPPAAALLAGAITGLSDGFSSLFTAASGGGGALAPLFDMLRPIGLIIVGELIPALVAFGQAIYTGVQPIVAVLVDIFQNSLIPVFQYMVDTTGPLIQKLVETFQVLGTAVGPIFQGIADIIQAVWGFIGPFVIDIVKGLWDNIIGAFTGIFNVIQGVVTLVSALFTGDWAAAWEALKLIVSGALEAVWNIVNLLLVGKVLGLGKSALKGLGDIFVGGWNWIVGVVKGAGEGIWLAVKSSLETAALRVMYGIDAIKAFFTSGFGNAVTTVRTAFGNIVSGVATGISDAVAFVGSLPGKVLAVLGNLPGMLIRVGSQMMEGFIEGAKSMAGKIGNAVLSPIKDSVEKVKNFLGIHSPSRLMRGFGRNTSQGYALGIEDDASKVSDAMMDLAPDAPSFQAPGVEAGGLAGTLAALLAANTASDQPIYMDGSLFGILRKLANGEARIVLNQAAETRAAGFGGLI